MFRGEFSHDTHSNLHNLHFCIIIHPMGMPCISRLYILLICPLHCADKMVKAKEWSQKFREEIVALHKKGNGYKKISKLLNVPRDTFGSIIRKFRATGTAATKHGRGRKKKFSAAAARFMRRQVDKNPRLTAKELKEDLAKGGTEVSVDTVRRTLHAEGLKARTPRRTPLLKAHHTKICLQFARANLTKPQKFWDNVLWTDETKLELFGP